MELKLNRKKIKSLANYNKVAPSYISPQVADGANPATNFEICVRIKWCHTTTSNRCNPNPTDDYTDTAGFTFTRLDQCFTGAFMSTMMICNL